MKTRKKEAALFSRHRNFQLHPEKILCMALYRLPAIVLHTRPFQDSHLLVSLLSPGKGKVRVLAKGSRRIQSGLGRLTQPMVYAVFQLAEGKNLDVITQGALKSAFPKLRSSLESLFHGLYALELIERLVEEPEPDSRLFFLLLKTLEGLEEGEKPGPLLRVFEAHLFRLLGYAPEVKLCLLCRASVSEGVFSVRLGGVLCRNCFPNHDLLAYALRKEVKAALEKVMTAVPGKAIEVPSQELQEIGKIFQQYVEEKWGKKIHGFELIHPKT